MSMSKYEKELFEEKFDAVWKLIKALSVDLGKCERDARVDVGDKSYIAFHGWVYDNVPASQAISAIIDHLGMKIEKVPSKGKHAILVEKDD